MRVAVIGAGPAGITAAYQLTKGGAEVDVYEAGPHVGGMARSLDLWGQRVDLGPHRFLSADARVNKLWLEVVGRDYRLVDRLTRIYYRGKFFQYPLRPLDALAKLGPIEAARCVASYAAGRARGAREGDSFEDWVVARFGRRLFEIFFKTYSEKLWGISCADLDADFATQRIKKLSLLEAIKNAFALGGARHKTLAERFAYPKGGTGMVYERMAAAVRDRGGRVHLSSPVQRVVVESGRARGLELEGGERVEVDRVVSSMPLSLLVSRLPGAPEEVLAAAAALRFRNTILVYLHVDAPDLFPDNWLYVHAPDLRMGRLTNFRNWVPELHGDSRASILVAEYWCNDPDPIWREPEEALVALASEEVRRTGLVRDAPILGGQVVRLHRCYPVYQRGYRQGLGAIERYLRGIEGLLAIGRYGAFKYNNQDHSILMGLLAAENVLGAGQHDLWSINTDYDSYQESSSITEAGLEPAGA
ncbi:MAG TPA: FAD-dependent oxidoreductase [Myxococcales bacterium]|nr:FAD-dependent oxidoreductase [Myxococcales bacterium]